MEMVEVRERLMSMCKFYWRISDGRASSTLVALLLNCLSVPMHTGDTSWVSPILVSFKLQVHLVNIVGHLSHARITFLKQVISRLFVPVRQTDTLRGFFCSLQMWN